MCGQLKRMRLLKQNLCYFLYSFCVILWMELKRTKTEKVAGRPNQPTFMSALFSFQVHRWFSTVSLNRECYSRHIFFCKFTKKDLRQCEIISGCIYWHFEQFLNLCWMVSIAANKVCIWPMLSLSLSVNEERQLLKKRVVEIHMVHYIILIICSQLYNTKKYGKVTVWKTICNFFGSCVNRNPLQLYMDKMTWGKMLSNYPNFWINCGQKKIHNIWTDHLLGFILWQNI